MSKVADQLRETWPILPDAGPVTAAQRQLAHDAAAEIERLEGELNSIGFGPYEGAGDDRRGG